jgi:hypothetical protein
MVLVERRRNTIPLFELRDSISCLDNFTSSVRSHNDIFDPGKRIQSLERMLGGSPYIWIRYENQNHTRARTTSLWFNERALIPTKTSKLPSGGVLTIRVFRPSTPEQFVRIHSLDLTLILVDVKVDLLTSSWLNFNLCSRRR